MNLGRWFLMGTVLTLAAPLFAQSPPSSAEIEAERAALFAQADADGNGALSLSEFKTFESLMRDKMAEHHFNHLDANGDGTVSLEELQADRPGPGFGHPPF
jgi:Ca2+-binding EF-hand superfamily protein